MSTVAEHREEIKDNILEGSFSDELIDKLINKAIRKMSSMVLLPVLERRSTVDTEVDNPYMDLPNDFGHNLFFASSAAGPIRVSSSMEQLLEDFPLLSVKNEYGDIEACCRSGSSLAFHPIPSVVTPVTLFYHSWPVVLDPDDSVDLYIEQEDDQEDIIHNFVLWRLQNQLEDGLDAPKTNTMYHLKEFNSAVETFSGTIKQGQSRPAPDRRSWSI